MAKKVKDPADPGPDHTLILIYFGFAVVGTLWVAVQLGNWLSSTKQNIPVNPIARPNLALLLETCDAWGPEESAFRPK